MTLNVAKIELLLAERGWTRKALSERCGISRQSISTIVRRGTCHPKNAGRLAAGLDVNVTDIIKMED